MTSPGRPSAHRVQEAMEEHPWRSASQNLFTWSLRGRVRRLWGMANLARREPQQVCRRLAEGSVVTVERIGATLSQRCQMSLHRTKMLTRRMAGLFKTVHLTLREIPIASDFLVFRYPKLSCLQHFTMCTKSNESHTFSFWIRVVPTD